MTHTATIFGFGSFFRKGPGFANDIDLLLLHRTVDFESIEFAIGCKKMIRGTLPKAHVVMLSDAEERERDFIRRSSAVFLAEIESDLASGQIVAFSAAILRDASGRTRQGTAKEETEHSPRRGEGASRIEPGEGRSAPELKLRAPVSRLFGDHRVMISRHQIFERDGAPNPHG
jgi:hypothetical protein